MLTFMDGLLSIGEFSNSTGLSHKRLRSYASAGLLTPAAVDPTTGYRYYSPEQQGDARLIDVLRAAGMPMPEIGEVLRDRSPIRLDEWARRVDDDVADRHRALETARTLLASTNTTPCHERKPMRTRTAARSETGPVRDTNEDALIVRDNVVIVADGMGGAPGGETASSLAVTVIDGAITGLSSDELPAGIRAANRAILERSTADPTLDGMGTTACATAVLDDGRLAVANVGDTRALLLREGHLLHLTDDHTVAGELVRRGELAPSAAETHPHRHVLTRVLGASPTLHVDVRIETLQPGDRLLVCTDGLWNEFDDANIASLLATPNLQAAIDTLTEAAIAAGGADNITAVGMDFATDR